VHSDQALGVGAGLVQLPHVAQDPDPADHLAVGVAQRRGVEGRGDHLAARAPRIEPGIAGHAPLDDFPKSGKEFPGFVGRDDARERLLDQFVRAESEEGEHGIVGLQDFPSRSETKTASGAFLIKLSA